MDSFQQLVDPQCEISAEVTQIHGITNKMVRGKPTICEVLPRFVEFLGGPDSVLLAHNAAFDLGFLGFAMWLPRRGSCRVFLRRRTVCRATLTARSIR